MTKISRYVLYISLILNAILLMYLAGIVPFFLYISILVNVFLLWYSYQFINENKKIEEDLGFIFQSTDKFINHLENLYELEMYYGDQNLESLIIHSKELINEYIDMQERYFDIEVEIESDEEYDESSEEEGETQEE